MYQPASTILKCLQCKSEFAFEVKQEKFSLLDFDNNAAETLASNETVQYVNCDSCGAQIIFSTALTDICPFCASSIVNKKLYEKQSRQLQGVIPFIVSREQAFANFSKWIKKLRFAPNDVTRFVKIQENFKGVYLPYYLMNYSANVEYKGKESGKNGQYYSGKRKIELKNIAILATNIIPRQFKDKAGWDFLRLEPWDNKWQFEQLKPFQKEFTIGYIAETPQISVSELLQIFKEEKDKTLGVSKLDELVEDELNRKIKKKEYRQILNQAHLQLNGDEEGLREAIDKTTDELASNDDNQIVFTDLKYSNEKIEYAEVLLPVWISAFRYKNKLYRFLVNGSTGEVVGDRPYSSIKLAIAWTLAVIAFLAIAFLVFNEDNSYLILIVLGIVYLIIQFTDKENKWNKKNYLKPIKRT